MTEINPRIVPIDAVDAIEADEDDGSATTIRVSPRRGSRQVRAFARLAAVVDRASATEVPTAGPPAAETGFLVRARPPDAGGTGPRLREEAIDALAQAEADHRAALERSRESWNLVHEREEHVVELGAEEAAALRAFELVRDSRRNAERRLRQARTEGDAASQHCLITSRLLDAARIRAERL